jgi:hypothetical protein
MAWAQESLVCDVSPRLESAAKSAESEQACWEGYPIGEQSYKSCVNEDILLERLNLLKSIQGAKKFITIKFRLRLIRSTIS